MEFININSDWLFIKKDGTQKRVSLPHDAMLEENRDARTPAGVNSGYFPGGRYVYTRTLFFESIDESKDYLLLFEGVYQNSKIYINGELVGAHKYGYTEFEVNITNFVKPGENELRVEADNRLVPNCRWYSGSGIYRSVWIYVVEKVRPTFLHITTISHSAAVIKVESDADCIEIWDGEKVILSGASGEYEIENAKLWTPDEPNLYKCWAYKGKECIEESFGIRHLTWSAQHGLCINGERILLRGGCIHHDHGVLGACDYYDAEYRRVSILKEMGFNCIRTAHNPASRNLLNICDELGMLVMNESFDGWYVPKTYHDYARWFDTEWKSDLAAMVKISYNHPSVIMYSHGNEVSETATKKGIETCKMLTDYIHSLDSTRPVTAGVNVLLNVYANMGIGVYKDKENYKPEPLPQKRGYREKKTGSAFFNAMANKLGGLMFFMAAGKKGDKATRGAAERLDVLGLNYAASRYDEDVRNYPDRLMVGSETMVADLPYNWERVKKYPQVLGDFVWSAWDYLGEACIGDWTYHSYKGLPLLAGQGMIDITGKPLASMYFMQVVWGLRKEPFIAVRPINHAKEKPSTGAWQFTNAIDSWTWHGFEGERATIEVYANAQAVKLLLNGKEIGLQPIKKYKAIFKTRYESGELMAIALDEEGNEISRHLLKTGKKDINLTAKPEKYAITADKKSLCYIPIEFTDKDGELLPYIEESVKVTVEGAATLAGLGSALCKTDERYTSDNFKAYRGRLLAVLRSNGEKGKIKVTISSKICEKATIEMEAE